MLHKRRGGLQCYRVLRSPEMRSGAYGGELRIGNTAVAVPPPPPCRICWEGESEETPDLLLGTCFCSGSLGAVHYHCLLQWQRLASDPETCAVCKAPIRIPEGVAARSRPPPPWAGCGQRAAAWASLELSRLWEAPASTLFRLWNHAVVAQGLCHAALHCSKAWAAAPGLAWRLREMPLSQGRWPMLAGLAAVSLFQRVWLPWLNLPQKALCLHAACYAAGAALDCGAAGLLGQLAGAGGAAAAWACKLVVCIGIALQVSAIQHLHPLRQFVLGYSQGINAACAATGTLLLRAFQGPLRALGCCFGGGSGAGRLAEGAARALPFFLHSIHHALGFAGRLME